MSSIAAAIAFGPAGSSPWMPARIQTAGPVFGERSAMIGSGVVVPAGADCAMTSARPALFDEAKSRPIERLDRRAPVGVRHDPGGNRNRGFRRLGRVQQAGTGEQQECARVQDRHECMVALNPGAVIRAAVHGGAPMP